MNPNDFFHSDMIKTDDFYKDISGDVPEWYDTSNYDEDHPLFSKNKKVVGMMKDECGGRQIIKFVGLRSKLYSYEMADGTQVKKCKGIRKYIIKNEIITEDFEECLFSGKPQFRTMSTIRSRQHDVETERINKAPLSTDDDKRIVSEDKITTMAIGNWQMQE